MTKKRKKMTKRRKNGATHVYLPIRVTFELIPYMIALHA
jgi:hypothetical protein